MQTNHTAMRFSLMLLFVAHCFAASAATTHLFECPAHLSSGGKSHPLENASLFDGPAAQMADLIPVSGKTGDRWDLAGVDPYLVCRYRGTGQVLTLHAEGARNCEAAGDPFVAYCD